MRHDLHLKQMDVNTEFLNSSLVHQVLERFSTGYIHPFGHAFVILVTSLCGVRQDSGDWYTLQHTRLLSFDPDLNHSIADACFYYKVEDGFQPPVVHMDDYVCAYLETDYFDA